MKEIKYRKTLHYKKYHENDVPWSLVIQVISRGKRKKIGKNLIQFTSKSKKQEIYVLCKREGNVMKVINAKRKKLRR